MKKAPSHRDSFLPDFCNLHMAFVVILMAELLAIILTLSHSSSQSGHFQMLALLSLFIQWIALSCTSVLCLANRFLLHLENRVAATVAYALVIITAAIIIELSYWIFSQWLPILVIENHQLWLIRNLSISAITAAIALRYFYVRNQWRLNVELQALARFQALQARIRPHFFFNCMNTIAGLTRSKPELAEKAIEDLADLFRASLKDLDELITLREEIELCERYLSIEKLRFGDRLQIEWSLELPEEDVEIPPLILQPLIENAIYHGIETRPEGGCINIGATSDNDAITISIQNPYAGENSKHQGNQIAQDNIRQRLNSIYDDQAELTTCDDNDSYRVQMRIPIHHENPDR